MKLYYVFCTFQSPSGRDKWFCEIAKNTLLNTFSKSKKMPLFNLRKRKIVRFWTKIHQNILNFAIFWFVFEGTWDHAWHFFAICDIIVIFCTGTKDNLEMVVFFRNVLIVSIWHCCVIRALLITFASHTMWLDNRKTTSERISNGLKTF